MSFYFVRQFQHSSPKQIIFKVLFLHDSTKAHSSTPTSLSPGSVSAHLSHFSQHALQPLFKARLPERANGLQYRFCHRVPELLEKHPEEKHHQHHESEKHPHIQAQVPAPAQRQGQRRGSHQEFSGGRHGVIEPAFTLPRMLFNKVRSSREFKKTLRCSCRSNYSARYPTVWAML